MPTVRAPAGRSSTSDVYRTDLRRLRRPAARRAGHRAKHADLALVARWLRVLGGRSFQR